jgi:membrane complex biogenesis BtpA family protein
MLHAVSARRKTPSFDATVDWVLNDAAAWPRWSTWLDTENFGDVPFYARRVPAHTAAFMTAIGREVVRPACRSASTFCATRESALAAAVAAGAEFIRVNIHAGARLTDQGLIEGVAHETLRYRKLLGCDVKIFADVDSKHSVAVAPRPLADEVEEILGRGCADAVIVTGSATGRPTAFDDLKSAKGAAGHAPVFAGSGVDVMNLAKVLSRDGVIVGTAFKKDSVIANPADMSRVRAFAMEAAANSSVFGRFHTE